MILVLDTHAEDVFIGFWDRNKSRWEPQETFLGGRELNSLIIGKLSPIKTADLNGIIVAAGPGSFTGLRIGISVANAIAYVKDIPIVALAGTETRDELLQKGLRMLESAGSQFDVAVIPFYGADPHITKPKS